MAVLLTDLTPSQLDQLISQATARKKQLKKRKPIATVRAKVEAAARASGYTIAELFSGTTGEAKPVEARKATSRTSRAGAKVAPKYRNPKDPAQTWSGRGLKPVWLRDAISDGKSKLEDFAI